MQLCVYGDSAYSVRIPLQAPFRGNNFTSIQRAIKAAMSNILVAVEWLF